MDFFVWKSINEGYSWESIDGIPESDKIIAMFQNPYFNKYVSKYKVSILFCAISYSIKVINIIYIYAVYFF